MIISSVATKRHAIAQRRKKNFQGREIRVPVFPAKTKVVHHGFDDPAAASGTGEEVLDVFRRVRDEIRDFVASLPEGLGAPEPEK